MTAREAAPRAVRGQVLRFALSGLLAFAIFWFLTTRVDVSSAWAAIRAMSWLELLTIAMVTAWNLLTYWALWVAATPGLRWSQAAVLAQSGTALTNTVPGGSALGVRLAYAMLASWGFSRARSSQAVLVTGGWNLAVKLGLPVVALGLLALQGDTGHGRLTAGLLALAAAAVATVLGVLLLRSERTARALGETAGRAVSRVRRRSVTGWGESTVDFRRHAGGLLGRRWPVIAAAAVASPPVALSRAAGHPAARRGHRRRGRLGRGALRLRDHPAAHRGPDHAGRCRRDRGAADRRAHRRRRGGRHRDGGGPGVPRADLAAAGADRRLDLAGLAIRDVRPGAGHRAAAVPLRAG